MKPKVYLETSFISYLTSRFSHDLVILQRQLSSRRWWDQMRKGFDLLVSQTVYEECWKGDERAVAERVAVLNQTTLLPLTAPILYLASKLVDPRPFPKRADADAVHIAVATAYGCEYLLTWNFKHINNAQLKRAATRIMGARL